MKAAGHIQNHVSGHVFVGQTQAEQTQGRLRFRGLLIFLGYTVLLLTFFSNLQKNVSADAQNDSLELISGG